MVQELVSFNIRIPWILDTDILETLGSGIWVILEQHKGFGLSTSEMSVMEHAKLTMGDHASELCDGTDESFYLIYQTACDGLNRVLASQGIELETFATQIDTIDDIMVFCYEGLIRLCVSEKRIYDSRYFDLLLSE